MAEVALEYRLADLLMFTVEVFQRLYIRLNEELWPWQLPVLLLALLVIPLLARPSRMARRLAVALLAMAWAASGGIFLMHYYTPINWPAWYAAVGFLVQSLLVLVLAGTRFLPARLPLGTGVGMGLVGLWMIVLCALPWLSALEAGDWRAVALFGLTPDLTALGWVICSVLVPRRIRWLLLLVPLLWFLFSAGTLLQLEANLMALVPLAGLLLGVGVALKPVIGNPNYHDHDQGD